MWRTWLFFDFKKAFIALHIFLVVMVLTNHFFVLSHPRYDFLNTVGMTGEQAQEAAMKGAGG